jgi:hypothetical protein
MAATTTSAAMKGSSSSSPTKKKRALPPQEQIWAGKVPIVLPSQLAAPAEEGEEDWETAVDIGAIFPSRGVDIDGLYESEVRGRPS